MRKTKYGKPFLLLKIEINKDDFDRIKNNFFQDGHTRHVDYAYLDSHKDPREAQLFRKNIRLRIRIKNHNSYMLEYVRKFDNRVESARTPLHLEEFDDLCSSGHIPNGEVKDKLIESNSLVKVIWLGNVITIRSKTFFRDGILVLDKSIYRGGRVYHELEFRSDIITTEEFSDFDLLKGLDIHLIEDGARKSKLHKFWDLKN